MLCRIPDVDGVVLAVFTDASARSVLPHADFAHQFSRRIEQSGFRLIDSLCQAADGWGSYFDPHLPAGGHPLAEVEESAARLRPLIPETPSAEGEITDATPRQRTKMRKELASIRALAATIRDVDETPARLEPLEDLPAFFEKALEWNDDDADADGALLVFALQGPPMRDCAMLQWATHLQMGELLFDDAVRFREEGLDLEDPTSNALAGLMMGVGPRPDERRLEEGISVLMLLVSRAETAEHPALLCMLAWLNWALGRGSRSGWFVDRARAIDPGYGLAELLDTMLSNGMLPEWLFESPDQVAEV